VIHIRAALMLLFAAAPALRAQERLTPGSPLLKPVCGDVVTDTIDLTGVTIGRPDRVTNSFVRTRQRIQYNGRDACMVVRRFLGPQVTNTDTTVYDAATLAPLRFVVHQTSGNIDDFTLAGDTITHRQQQPDSTIAMSQGVLPQPVFLGPVDHAVVEAMPLNIRIELDFDLWSPPSSMEHVRATVTGIDTLTVRGQRIAAWRILWNDGSAQSTYWISRDQPRLVRSRTILPNGEFWRLIRGDAPGG
jgi:hypothetical protein